MLELELGTPLPAVESAALDRHTAACAACAARRAAEVRLSAALGELGGEAPFAVDVAARVRATLSRSPTPRRAEIGPGQLVAAAAVALATAAAMSVALLRGQARLVDLAGELWLLAGALWTSAAPLGRAVAGLAAVPARVALGLGESLAGATGLWDALQPLAFAASLAGTTLMAATVMLVVGRDLVGRRAHEVGGTAR